MSLPPCAQTHTHTVHIPKWSGRIAAAAAAATAAASASAARNACKMFAAVECISRENLVVFVCLCPHTHTCTMCGCGTYKHTWNGSEDTHTPILCGHFYAHLGFCWGRQRKHTPLGAVTVQCHPFHSETIVMAPGYVRLSPFGDRLPRRPDVFCCSSVRLGRYLLGFEFGSWEDYQK